MLKKFFIGLAVLLAIFAIVVALQPSSFRIERNATINAAPDKVFTQVNDFHNWQDWSPWAKLDPKASSQYAGPKSGEGAKFSWDGNSNVGVGAMTIMQSQPHKNIGIKLDFVEPMAATSDVRFTFKPNGKKTDVTWTMEGQASFIEKAMALLVFDRDEMIGGMFEKGLKNLDAASQAASR